MISHAVVNVRMCIPGTESKSVKPDEYFVNTCSYNLTGNKLVTFSRNIDEVQLLSDSIERASTNCNATGKTFI